MADAVTEISSDAAVAAEKENKKGTLSFFCETHLHFTAKLQEFRQI